MRTKNIPCQSVLILECTIEDQAGVWIFQVLSVDKFSDKCYNRIRILGGTLMVTLNSIFTSHMVLQAGKPIRFFGDGNGEVAICFNGERKKTIANGNWLIEFSPRTYGGPFSVEVALDGSTTVLSDVWVGDVYLLGGQSNMELKMWQTSFPAEKYTGNENVRLYVVDKPKKEEITSADGWVTLTAENAVRFSAIGYHVASALANENRKVGLVGCYQGASVIQSWMPKEVAAQEKFQVQNKYKDHTKYPHNGEGQLFDYMVSKILPYSMNTVLWYQGESNVSDDEAGIYLPMLEEMIAAWRKAFCDKTLPFIVVQIADFDGRDFDAWHLIQREQMRAQETIPNVKTVVSRDVCESDNIHPMEKEALSKRIAALL